MDPVFLHCTVLLYVDILALLGFVFPEATVAKSEWLNECGRAHKTPNST